MPESAGSWTHTARFCPTEALAIARVTHIALLARIALLALMTLPAQAATNSQLGPEQDDVSPAYLYSIAQSDVTLTGFHCGVINNPNPALFAADPDYRETPPTVGLTVLLEEASSQQTPSAHVKIDDASSADMRTPLSARLSRMLVQEEMSYFGEGSEMEDVFVPEASMSVADLVALCSP